ncbi:MAG: hypothetical protein LBL33_06825 [Tannerella sp.]|jgi:hypothetical protein|nr:hypothetical protein [Tannerella sp.]
MTHAKQPLFPRKVSEAVADLDSKRKYLKSIMTRLGIPSAEISRIDTAVNAVLAANTIASDPDTRTKLDIANRDLAIETAQGIERKVIDFYVVGNPNATEVDYEALRIPQSGPHPHLPDPKAAPGVHLTSKELAIIATFFDTSNGHHGKPDGVQAIEVYLKVGGEPPVTPSEMTERKVGTSSPMYIQFEFDQELQIVYLVFRWVGTRGTYGPWSEIHKIAIIR